MSGLCLIQLYSISLSQQVAGLQALANVVAETQIVLLNEVRFIYRDSHLYAGRIKEVT